MKLTKNCKQCEQIFLVKNKEINRGKKFGLERGIFCSNSCATKHRHNSEPKMVTCSHCQTIFKKKANQIKKSTNHFCSKSCSVTFNNKNKQYGLRRSKLEIWLEEKLTLQYSSLEFHFNKKEAISSELDIFIPSLKLAFELNGIFHYEPIFGSEKLLQSQINDENKSKTCKEKHISLFVVNTSQQKYFKEKSSEQYLNFIVQTIDRHLAVNN